MDTSVLECSVSISKQTEYDFLLKNIQRFFYTYVISTDFCGAPPKCVYNNLFSSLMCKTTGKKSELFVTIFKQCSQYHKKERYKTIST